MALVYLYFPAKKMVFNEHVSHALLQFLECCFLGRELMVLGQHKGKLREDSEREEI